MLPTNMLIAATGAMRSLHDSVLALEKRRLREKDVAYPVFAAKERTLSCRLRIAPVAALSIFVGSIALPATCTLLEISLGEGGPS